MIMKKLFFLMTALFVLAGTVFAQSEDDFVVTQNTDGKTVTITGYKGSAKEIVIPATLFGLRVTAIGNFAFRDKGLTAVTILEGTVTIGGRAFSGNSLVTVVIPNTVTTIGEEAFSNSKITSLTIGNRVATIGSGAFSKNLFTELTIPNSVTTIGDNAFMGNKISVLSIPSSIKTIGNNAFSGNKISVLSIPSSVTYIGVSAFAGNPLTSITLAKDLPDGDSQGSYYNISQGISVHSGFSESFINFYTGQRRAPGIYVLNGQIWSKVTAAEAARLERERAAAQAAAAKAAAEVQAAADAKAAEAQAAAAAIQAEFDTALKNSGYTANVLANSTLEITGYTGRDQDLVIPSEIGGRTVTAIADNAFREKTAAGSITSVVIPDTVETIGNAVFSNRVAGNNRPQRSKLASVTLGTGLKSIGIQAFLGNTTLKTIVFKSVPTLGTDVFTGCGLTSITIPAQAERIAAQFGDDFASMYKNYSAGIYTKIPLAGWVKKPGSGN
jgi:hypothetical protein